MRAALGILGIAIGAGASAIGVFLLAMGIARKDQVMIANGRRCVFVVLAGLLDDVVRVAIWELSAAAGLLVWYRQHPPDRHADQHHRPFLPLRSRLPWHQLRSHEGRWIPRVRVGQVRPRRLGRRR